MLGIVGLGLPAEGSIELREDILPVGREPVLEAVELPSYVVGETWVVVFGLDEYVEALGIHSQAL